MQQHAVPQNVTQYQFRLVGDMTLKQFLELAGGLVLAWLFYASNLIFIIKWPFALLSLFFGIALAFFPIEDRPLDVWILNFIRSIYAPTRFIWTKTTRLPSLFTFKPHEIVERVTATKTIKAPPLPTNTRPVSDLSAEEVAKLKDLDSLFSQTQAPTIKATIKPTNKPSIKVRQLKSPGVIFQAKPTALPSPAPTSPSPAEAFAKAGPIPTPSVTVEANNDSPTPSQPAERIHLPAAPKKPNLIVGMITDKEGGLADNAIVEITTQDGLPVRAIKTNSLGQFYISTPLSKGNYTIQVEKEGLTFVPQSLKVEDKLISPLILRAS